MERVILEIDYEQERAKRKLEELSRKISEAEKAQERLNQGAKGIKELEREYEALSRSVKLGNKAIEDLQVRATESTQALNKNLSAVKMNVLMVLRDAPYGLMGVMNNIEVLTDTIVRTQQEFANAGKNVSAFSLIMDSLKSLLTSPAGIISAVGLLSLTLGDKLIKAIESLTGNAFPRLKAGLENLMRRFGLLNKTIEGFKDDLQENFEKSLNAGNINQAFSALNLFQKKANEIRRLNTVEAALLRQELRNSKNLTEKEVSAIEEKIKAIERQNELLREEQLEVEKLQLQYKNLSEKVAGKRAATALLEAAFLSEKSQIDKESALLEATAILGARTALGRRAASIETRMRTNYERSTREAAELRAQGRVFEAAQLQAELQKEFANLIIEREELDKDYKRRSIAIEQSRLQEIIARNEQMIEGLSEITKRALTPEQYEGGIKQINELFFENAKRRKQLFDLDIELKRINEEAFSLEVERSRFRREELKRLEEQLKVLSEISFQMATGVDIRSVAKQIGENMDLSLAFLEEVQAKELVAIEGNEAKKTEIIKKYAIERLEIQKRAVMQQIALFGEESEEGKRFMAQLSRINAQLMLMQEQNDEIRMNWIRIGKRVGAELGEIIASQIRFNSEAARLERERAAESIRIERERIAERRRLLDEEHYRDKESIERLRLTQQISEAEAARRVVEVDKKRAQELAEIRRRETDLIDKENRLRGQSFAQLALQNVTNSAVQIGAEFLLQAARTGVLNPLTAAFLVGGIIAAATAIRSMLASQVQMSFAAGRMFEEPTLLGGVMVGDAQRVGAPVNFEALLNAAQLAEFGKRYSAEREMIVNLNVAVHNNLTQLVERIEEKKILYAKAKMRSE